MQVLGKKGYCTFQLVVTCQACSTQVWMSKRPLEKWNQCSTNQASFQSLSTHNGNLILFLKKVLKCLTGRLLCKEDLWHSCNMYENKCLHADFKLLSFCLALFFFHFLCTSSNTPTLFHIVLWLAASHLASGCSYKNMKTSIFTGCNIHQKKTKKIAMQCLSKLSKCLL